MPKDHLDTSVPFVPEAPAGDGLDGRAWPPLVALLAPGQPLAVSEIARRTGLAGELVARQVAALRAAGLTIEDQPGGYRLHPPLEALDLAALRGALPPGIAERLGGLANHWCLDSTSSELARRAAHLPDLAFVFADWQRAGRGRRGRSWVSPPAANLQFSCLKRFAGGYAALSGLSLAAGIAVVRALDDCGIVGIRLKWPNDLVHDDAKLGGILVDLGGNSMGPCHAIVGIGINRRLPAAARAALGRACTDLATLAGERAPSRTALAAALVARLSTALDTFGAQGFAAFAEAWRGRDALAGRRIRVEDGRGGFTGIAAGVDAHGALLVRAEGAVRRIDSAEVTVRPA